MLVNIRGSNGAGKSTIPMAMLDDEKLRVVGLGPEGKAPYLTIFPSYQWVALGTYYNKTGGLDTYKNNAMTAMALEEAWTKYPEYDVLMEGIIASTIKSTYKRLFDVYQEKVYVEEINPRKIIIMSFLPPVEVCINRVYLRNGGKAVNEKAIRSKWDTVDRNSRYFKEQGFTSLRINNANCPKEKMLLNFLNTVDKYRGGLES